MRLLKTHPTLGLVNTRFLYMIISIIMTLIIFFVLALAVSLLINSIFTIETQHCAEQTPNAYAAAKDSTGKLVAELASNSSRTLSEHIAGGTSSISLDQQQEIALNTVNNPARAALARVMGQGVEYTVNNFNFWSVLETVLPAGTVAAVAWKNTPGGVYAAAGLAAAATSTGVGVGSSIKIWLQRPTPVVNNMQNSGSNTNSNVNSSNPDYSVHSSLEEGDSISSFMESIFQYVG